METSDAERLLKLAQSSGLDPKPPPKKQVTRPADGGTGGASDDKRRLNNPKKL